MRLSWPRRACAPRPFHCFSELVQPICAAPALALACSLPLIYLDSLAKLALSSELSAPSRIKTLKLQSLREMGSSSSSSETRLVATIYAQV